MNRKQFALYRVTIAAAIGVVIAYAVLTENAVLAMVAVIIGMALLYLAKRKVAETVEDERIYRISGKASRRTLEIFGIGIALTGITLLALKEFTEAGYALAFSACILGLLHSVFYSYYRRRSLK